MCCVVAAETRAAQPEERGARKQQHGFAKLRNFSNFHFTRVGWEGAMDGLAYTPMPEASRRLVLGIEEAWLPIWDTGC
jgi:hypothetical protein